MHSDCWTPNGKQAQGSADPLVGKTYNHQFSRLMPERMSEDDDFEEEFEDEDDDEFGDEDGDDE